MKYQLINVARTSIDSVLGAVGLQRSRRGAYTDYRDYIPFKETVEGAQRAGLSVGDYIDAHHNQPGMTQMTIDQIAALGVFRHKIERVCEIGPGSGRYLERTMRACSPSYYEIYETAKPWEQWLIRKYNVVSQPADGSTLRATPSASIDLVHAHKVISGQPTLTAYRYFSEMARVTCSGGYAIFDIVTEACLDEATLQHWFETRAGYQHYPCLIPKQFTLNFFAHRGLTFVGSFLVPMEPGKTECMVFRKQAA